MPVGPESQRTFSTADVMNAAVSPGFAMKATCEPSIFSVVAPMQSAMKRSASGLIALSWADTRNHDGCVFQPGTPVGSFSA